MAANAIYLDKTGRHYGVRVFKHLGISLLTHKKYTYNSRNSNNSAILNHINCNSMCIGEEENFKIIGSSHTDFTLCIKESLLIHKDKHNIRDRSMPLYLFE